MKEIQVIHYQAEDGKVFRSKEECLKHEERLLQVDKILELIPVVKEICREHLECSTCPFYSVRGYCRFGYDEDCSLTIMPCESWIS
jgi:hypothetical protein